MNRNRTLDTFSSPVAPLVSAMKTAMQAPAEMMRTTVPPLPSSIQPNVVSNWLTDLPKKISSSEFQPMIDTYCRRQ